MTSKGNHQRHRSLFQKGMTLEDYVRNMEQRQSNIPTADTYDNNIAQENQECLYKTTQNFYNPPPKPFISSIKQIQEESYDESMDQYRQSVNVVSTNLKKMGKQIVGEDHQKNYRIRNGRSVSPYTHNKQRMENIQPLKTFTNKFYKFEEYLPCQYAAIPGSGSPTLLSLNEESKKSKKKLQSTNNADIKIRKMNNTMTGKWHNNNNNKFITALDKVDLRIQTFKGRLEQKKKNKKGLT